jgi:hypothetical protein
MLDIRKYKGISYTCKENLFNDRCTVIICGDEYIIESQCHLQSFLSEWYTDTYENN